MKEAFCVLNTAHTHPSCKAAHYFAWTCLARHYSVDQISPILIGQFGTLGHCDQVAESLYYFARREVTSPRHRETWPTL